MNGDIKAWIETAIVSSGVKAAVLDPVTARSIVDQARSRFVNGSPRSWWMSLSTPAWIISSLDRRLTEVVPSHPARCWLIGETEMDDKPVFEIEVKDAATIIDASPYFEYYLVGVDYSWLLAESDHNEFYLCHATVPLNQPPVL